jgi:hypothetical protein
MAGNGANGRWRPVLRYAFAGLLGLFTVVATVKGAPWYLSLFGACIVFMLVLGRRRIFRTGITRTTSEIVCRYIPWYEGNAYVLNVGFPLIAVAMVAAGYAPGYPAWLRFGGFILLGLMPVIVFSVVSMWRRCFLRITPSALTVRLTAPKEKPTTIRRELVESITPKIVPNRVSGESLQVEIAYRGVDLSSDATKTVMLGLQLSVQPVNLLNALATWKEATHDDPGELLDCIERILRGRSTANG